MDNRVGTFPAPATAGQKHSASDDNAAPSSSFGPDPGGTQSSAYGQQQQQQGRQMGPYWNDAAPAAAKRRRSVTPREGCTMCRLRKVRQETALSAYAGWPACLLAC